MSSIRLTLVHLFPSDMNVYGDHGNVLALRQRARWRGWEVRVVPHEPGDSLPSDVDLVVGGGGQDSGQLRVAGHLQRVAPVLRGLAADGVPMLVVCGMYQLFGRSFVLADGTRLPGVGLFAAETRAGARRLVGDVVADSALGHLVGYENHAGVTRLEDGQAPFATVIHGAGNNGKDRTEGCQSGSVIGTYLHGSFLPRNPVVADELLRRAVERRHGTVATVPLDDHAADLARLDALRRAGRRGRTVTVT
jgi:hypothetical protein